MPVTDPLIPLIIARARDLAGVHVNERKLASKLQAAATAKLLDLDALLAAPIAILRNDVLATFHNLMPFPWHYGPGWAPVSFPLPKHTPPAPPQVPRRH